jgi:Ca-activated chloride channel family protein
MTGDQTHYLQFAHAEALWGLLIVPVLAWLEWRAARKRREAVAAFASASLAPRLIGGAPGRSDALRRVLRVAACALLVVALARPRLGTRLERVERRGADILVAVDVSDSMLAQDAQPSRLEAAKRELLGLISRLQGDRIGLLTFSTQAFLYCPLTVDYDAASMFVESIDPQLTSGAGTALSPALREAQRAFGAGQGEDRVLVLLSDGDDWGGGAEAAARALSDSGVRLFAIGIGTAEGAPIPIYDDQGRLTGTRRDEGKVVVTKLNADGLTRIAQAGRGRYFEGGTADHGAAAVYGAVSALQAAHAGQYTFRAYAERFQWPLGAGLMLMALELIAGLWPRRWRLRLGRSALVGTVLLCFLCGSGFSLFETAAGLCRKANRLFETGQYAEALQRYLRALDLEPASPILQFNAGDAYAKQQKFDEAREAFGKAAATSDLDLAGRAHYNLGNTHLGQQELDAALEAYKNALRCNPADPLAKRNLEIALQRKRQQPQQQPQEQPQSRPQQSPQPPQQPTKPQPHPQPPEASSQKMTPDEARALLRQAAYDDGQLRKELARVMPRAPETKGKAW